MRRVKARAALCLLLACALLLGVRAFEKTELNGTFNLYDAQMLHEEGKNESC